MVDVPTKEEFNALTERVRQLGEPHNHVQYALLHDHPYSLESHEHESIPIPPSSELYRHTTYEEDDVIVENPQTSTIYGITTNDEVSRRGTQSGQALLLDGDEFANGGPRAEYHGVDWVDLNIERWHGISFLAPEDWHQGDRVGGGKRRIVYQFHKSGGPGWSPLYGVEIRSHDTPVPMWRLYRKDRYAKNNDSWGYKNTKLWEEPLVVDEFIDFVVHVKWTVDNSGYFEFYRNKEKVWEDHNIMTMNDAAAVDGPYSKWGIYGQPTRIIFDEIRIAEGSDRLVDVTL